MSLNYTVTNWMGVNWLHEYTKRMLTNVLKTDVTLLGTV